MCSISAHAAREDTMTFARHALLVVAAMAIFFAVASAGDSPATLEKELQHNGITRHFRVMVPPQYDGQTALPLVVVLHGGGGNPKNIERTTGFSEKARAEGFFAIYPAGTGRVANRLLTWNAGNCCGRAKSQNADDVGFIRAILAALKAEYKIDPARVYASGMSNGGMMSYRLACELADQIVAIAPVAGAQNVPECRPAAPVSVIAFHGMADQRVRYEGGPPKKRADRSPRDDQALAGTMQFWTERNKCMPIPYREKKGVVIHNTYGACPGGVAVESYLITDGGHAWPGGQKGWPGGDKPSPALSATDLAWDFFKAHPRP
jgi:polyhydroxybutyrate depolymerase